MIKIYLKNDLIGKNWQKISQKQKINIKKLLFTT